VENIDNDFLIKFKDIEEGDKISRIIESKKRNSIARKLKLEEFKWKHGTVYCEVCGEDDICALDVHHDEIKVCDMEEGHVTRLSDLRVLCAN